VPGQVSHRERGDLCPGLLRPFPAGDGAIVRLRLPGGLASIGLLTTLVRLAEEGTGFLQLTSRGNLQLRGLPTPLPQRLIDAVLATELVPTPSHERVRNIVSSPLSGIWPVNAAGGPSAVADVRSLVLELDRLICADPVLAGLSGRFLFAVDDGRGDQLTGPFDVAYRALDETSGEIRLGTDGFPGFRVSSTEAPAALVEIARIFQQLRTCIQPHPWHLREIDRPLPGVPRQHLGQLPTGPAVAPGAIGPHAVAGLPLGRIDRNGLTGLRRMTDRVVLTGRRSLIVPGAADRLDELAAAGLVVDPDSGWAQVTACSGAPGCALAAASTELVARDVVAAVDAGLLRLSKPVHLVACSRCCGAAAGSAAIRVESQSAAEVLHLLG
jgi:precorrin-3B synthase